MTTTTEQDILAGRINAALEEWEATPPGQGHSHAATHVAANLLSAGYRRRRTLTTVEQIKDLPALTMVVHDDMANGGPLEAYVVPDDGTVMFKDRYPFHLLCMNGEYVNADDMPLPLTVVYEVGA